MEFWASWCGTCRYYSPVVTQFAQDNAGKVLVVRINASSYMSLLVKYGKPFPGTYTYGLPQTVFLDSSGNPVYDLTGYEDESTLAYYLGLM